MLKKEGRRGQTVRASAFLPGLQKYTYERKISVKKTLKRISCLLLALCLLASVVMPAQAAEEKTVVDFVLVLDCSNTMNRYDPEHLAATACKMFIDMIPIQDARVSVITFGYTGGGFDFKTFKVDYDKNLIHQIAPLTGNMTAEQKAELQEKITAAAKKKGDNTPVGQALAAAVETLINGGSSDGNACVILLSDGGLTSPIAFNESIQLVDAAAKKASEHEWPIYCIELDFQNLNDSKTKENRTRLNRICELSGAGQDGRTDVKSPEDVWNAFWRIFEKFTDPVDPEYQELVIGADGTVEKTFQVPDLASETNIIIQGGGVTAVELTNKTQNTSVKFTESKAEKKYIVNVDPSYFSVKIVCPESGEWVAKVYGNANAKVDAYSHHVREMNLAIVASPDGSERLTKNDKIKFQSYFTYGGVDQHNLLFYGQSPANLVVTSQDGTVKEYVMDADTNGYKFELPVSDIPSGTFTAQVILKHDMFRNGETVSDPITFTSENLPLTLRPDAGPISLEANVNGTFEALDMYRIYDNPDGDPVSYELTCTSDPTVKFDANHDNNNPNVLHITTGLVPGTYQIRVGAKDPDMTEPLFYDQLTLVVKNTPIDTLKELERQRLWSDYYDNFLIRQNPDKTVLDIDLSEYFVDPDGVPLEYSAVTADQAGLVDASISNGVLHVEPLEEGDVVLTFSVSDKVEPINAELEIKVVSGKSEYWRTHWIYWAMAVAAIVAAVLICLYIRSHTFMKGSWMVTITKEYNSISSEVGLPARNLSVVKRAKNKPFLMKDLVNEFIPYMNDQFNLKNELVNFLSTPEANAIKFKGIFKGLGFVVMDIPTGGKVEIEYNNQIKSGVKKFRVSGGDLRVTLKRDTDMGFSETMSIYFKNTGK